MPKDELRKYYDMLELPADASLRDIHNSFLRLKKIYSVDSIVLAPLGEEFSEKKRKKVLEQIEEAYVKLLDAKKDAPSRTAFLVSEEQRPEEASDSPGIGAAPLTGPSLRRIREKAKVELSEISKELKLRLELLKNIEEEKFEALPEAIYLKVHLRNYAAFLGLDPGRVAEEYLERYKVWKEKLPTTGK
jgi:hypothetical protein